MNIDFLWTMGIMFLARAEPARVIWQRGFVSPRAGRKGVYDSPPPLLPAAGRLSRRDCQLFSASCLAEKRGTLVSQAVGNF